MFVFLSKWSKIIENKKIVSKTHGIVKQQLIMYAKKFVD
jgi:hypothetical protein